MVHPEKAKNGHFGHFGQFCKNGHFDTISLKKRVFEDPQNPYFGHMRIDYDEGGRRDILIGKETFVSDGIRVVDWRNAPISRVFYQTRQGESFDVDIADREISGEMLARRTVTIRGGELQRISCPEGTFLYSDGHCE